MIRSNDPKQSQGEHIWQRLETLRQRLNEVYTAFDELYGYINSLRAEKRTQTDCSMTPSSKV